MNAFARSLRLQQSTLALACVLALGTACGGGGGGGHSIHLSTYNVDLVADVNGALPPTEVVTADFDGEVIIWGIPLDSPYTDLPAWLSFVDGSVYGDASRSYLDFAIGATTTSLTPGTYTFVMRVATGNQDGSDADYKDLTITYTVNDVIGIAAGAPPATLTAEAAPPAAEGPGMRVLGTAHAR